MEESKIQQSLLHPNIVRVHSSFLDKQNYFNITMEYCEFDLNHYLDGPNLFITKHPSVYYHNYATILSQLCNTKCAYYVLNVLLCIEGNKCIECSIVY
jgi:serine/threonine protein kinase